MQEGREFVSVQGFAVRLPVRQQSLAYDPLLPGLTAWPGILLPHHIISRHPNDLTLAGQCHAAAGANKSEKGHLHRWYHAL